MTMAYAAEFDRSCNARDCTKPATHRVYGCGNQPMGLYCKKHAKQRVDALSVAESNLDIRSRDD